MDPKPTQLKRWQNLLVRYGMTQEQYEQLLRKQGGVCRICKRLPEEARSGPTRTRATLCVDHCHETDTNRGLLCSDCNFLLAFAGDNPEVLRAAARYLKRFEDRSLPPEPDDTQVILSLCDE